MTNPAARSAERDNIVDVSKPAEGTIRTASRTAHRRGVAISNVEAVRRLQDEFAGRAVMYGVGHLRPSNIPITPYYRQQMLNWLNERQRSPLSQQQ